MFEREMDLEFENCNKAEAIINSTSFVTDNLLPSDLDGVSPFIFGKRYSRIEAMLF